MREIKFRAWDGKKMYEWGIYKDNFTGPPSTLNGNPLTMKHLQLTGLKDKNGKEIYEGDLLKITTTHGSYPVPVIWDEDSWTIGRTTGEFGTLSEWNKTSEIVGNIYETKT